MFLLFLRPTDTRIAVEQQFIHQHYPFFMICLVDTLNVRLLISTESEDTILGVNLLDVSACHALNSELSLPCIRLSV